jgi:hypothetical protein
MKQFFVEKAQYWKEFTQFVTIILRKKCNIVSHNCKLIPQLIMSASIILNTIVRIIVKMIVRAIFSIIVRMMVKNDCKNYFKNYCKNFFKSYCKRYCKNDHKDEC